MRRPRSVAYGGAMAPSVRMVLLAAGALALTASARAQVAPSEWHRAFVGVDYGRATVESPRPVRLHALRIDLRARGLRFLATPPNGTGEAHTTGLTTGSFLSAYRLQAAINAAPFGPIHKVEGKPVSVAGLTVSNGRVVSPATDLPALVISRRNEARIAEAPFDLRDVATAVAGFGVCPAHVEMSCCRAT
jgi:hypothetical protein